MRNELRRALVKTLAALVTLAGCMPVAALLCTQALAGREALWFAVPGSFALIALGASMIPKRKTRLLIFLPAAIACAAAWTAALLALGALPLIAVGLSAAMAVVLMPALRRPDGYELRTTFLMGAVVVGLFCWFLLRLDSLAGARGALRVALVAYLLLAPFYINFARVAVLQHNGKKPPRDVTSRNRVMVCVLCALAALISLWEQLAHWLSVAWEAIKYAFFVVVDFILSLLPDMGSPGDPAQAPATPDLGLMEPLEEAAPSPIIEIIVRLFAMIVLAGVLAFLLVRIGKWARTLYGMLRERIRRYGGDDGYEDETESIFDMAETTRAMRDRLSALRARRARPPKWESMTPRERVRYLYREYLQKNPDVKPSATARETLGDKPGVTPVYEAARYSEHEITEQQAETARDELGG